MEGVPILKDLAVVALVSHLVGHLPVIQDTMVGPKAALDYLQVGLLLGPLM